jgi:protein tyrosine phosphatase
VQLNVLGSKSFGRYSDIIRNVISYSSSLPTPEGLPPISVSSLNAHLSTVIQKFTLQGKDVLVHCRGGVGRAGVVACCWALKLGLCGWIETEVHPGDGMVSTVNADHMERSLGGSATGIIRRDTVKMVERVVKVVRTRRSIKAVETYEQVKFLVDFVEHLRQVAKERD